MQIAGGSQTGHAENAPLLAVAWRAAVNWRLTNYFREMQQSVEGRDRFRSRTTHVQMARLRSSRLRRNLNDNKCPRRVSRARKEQICERSIFN